MSRTVAIWGRDDFHDGSAVNNAFRSIQAAANSLAGLNGAPIKVYSGKYSEDIFISNIHAWLEGIGQVVFTPPNPSSYFLNVDSRFVTLTNLKVIGYTNTLKLSIQTHRSVTINDCQFIPPLRGIIEMASGSSYFPFVSTYTLYDRQDITGIDLERLEYCTFHDCSVQISHNKSGNGYLQNCIASKTAFEFLLVVPVNNMLFGQETTFTYDDGVNSVDAVDFSTFQAANQAHQWGFSLANCQVEVEVGIYVDPAQANFCVQPTSLAVGLSTNSGAVGAFQVGNQLLATEAGWQNNTGFTLNGDQYESSAAAEIESPVMDFGANKPIYRINGALEDSWEDGRLFNHLGQLDTPILEGGTQSGLAIQLTEGNIYSIDGFIEVITNQRSFTITSQQCFTALANEEIIAVTASGLGEIRELIYLDGQTRLLARWWKDGESEPSTWHIVTRNELVLVDANGKANGEPDYDATAFPRYPVARYLRVKPALTTNNLKS